MSFNGSGTFLINTAGQPVVAGTVISSTAFNALTADLATGLSTVITKDGQTTVTANIPMSTYKFTGLGVGSAATDSANLSQVQSTVTKLLTSVSGTDTITAVGAPVVAAYAAGQMFYFVATGDNTGAVTLNIDSLGAKAVTRDGSVALAAGDIKSGEVVVVVYDGTRFQVVSQLNSAGDARFANVSIASSLYVGGVSTFVGNAGFSANVSIASALSVGGVAAITGATTIGGNLTLNGGTANGVLYLNGSKVATSGTALTFTGSVLGVNNAGDSDFKLTTTNTGSGSTDGLLLRINSTGSEAYLWNWEPSSVLIFGANAAEQMRLTSTGLGIGTSSTYSKLYLKQSADGTPTGGFVIEANANDNRLTQYYHATNNEWVIAATYGSTGAFKPFTWWTSDTKRLTLDASGNLGLGVTPSAWSGITVFENKSGWLGADSAASTIYLGQNNYNDGSYKYKANGLASLYTQTAGQHRWYNAASGTAGGTISFTQAMTLTAAGALLVGTTSPFSGNSNTFNSVGITFDDWGVVSRHTASSQDVRCVLASAPNYSGNDGYFFIGNRSTGDRIYIRTSGDIANTNGSYGTISDQRLKQDIVDAPSQWNDLKAVRFRKYRLKDDVQADSNAPALLGVIAQELEQVCPGLVQGDELKTVKSSILLMKAAVALQEAMARIEQLEAKFAALETK
jgi:hypothetical protein